MKNKLKIVFAGTPQFAVPTLEKINNTLFDVVGVLTQPDRKAGRGMRITSSDVKKFAEKNNLLVMQPVSLNDDVYSMIKHLNADVLVVAAYGLIIPEKFLNLFKKGSFNVHASLLPRWRGAAPIHRAIESGDSQIGVTIMKVVKMLDAGPMIKKNSIGLKNNFTTGEMLERLAIMGADLILDILKDVSLNKKITYVLQDEEKVTYANKINKVEANLNLEDSPEKLIRKIRAFNPYPGIKYHFKGKILKIWNAALFKKIDNINLKTGDISFIDDKLILVLYNGMIELIELQLEGEKKMQSKYFIERFKIKKVKF